MAEQSYTGASTAPSVVLRFLAAPTDVNWGGKVHGGIVMRWIDEAAHVLVTEWTGDAANIAVYAGGVRFYQPLRIGDLVEVEARLIYTGHTSMHVSVHVRSGNPAELERRLTTHCLIVFVALSPEGTAVEARAWEPTTEEDVHLFEHAKHLIELRAAADDITPA
jgi:4-hydroxybenzoyl-CoA thioesterase